jgi:hypothetical protein
LPQFTFSQTVKNLKRKLIQLNLSSSVLVSPKLELFHGVHQFTTLVRIL